MEYYYYNYTAGFIIAWDKLMSALFRGITV